MSSLSERRQLAPRLLALSLLLLLLLLLVRTQQDRSPTLDECRLP